MTSSLFRKTLVVILGFAFSFNLVGAQVNWTPPAGPPTGNNTPAPVNVGSFGQWREGLLKIGPEEPIVDSNGSTIFSTRGGVIFDYTEEPFSNNGQSPTSPQNQSFVSFLRNALFAGSGSFTVGETNGLGGSPRIFLNGQLRYVPRNPNGSLIANQQPSAGKVLRALDDSGLVGWGDATGLPQGGNDGDILIWDSSTNTWITGPNSGSLPSGAEEWQTLAWNPYLPGGPAWEANNNLKVNTSLNTVSTTDETASVQLLTMDGGNVLVDTGTLDIQVPEVRLPLQVTADCFPDCIDMTGKILTSIDSGGLLSWVDPAEIGLGGGGVDPATMPPGAQGQTLWYNNGEWVSTGQIRHDNFSTSGLPPFTPRTIIDNPIISLGAQSSGNTRLNSPSVVFGSDTGGQNVRFNSSSVQFKGPANNSPLTPGIGRIPLSSDNDGTFKWNEFLTYQEVLLGSEVVDVFKLSNNPDNLGSIFVNEGLTTLNDDLWVNANSRFNGEVRIYDEDLFLHDIDQPIIASENIKNLCIDMITKKVILCEAIGFTGEPSFPGTTTNTWFAGEHSFTFPETGTAVIKLCGAGGGGGGGGRGWSTNPQQGHGGGGGGGGERGECATHNLVVNAGQEIVMDIGNPGSAGNGGRSVSNNPPSPQNGGFQQFSTDGGNGQPTIVTLGSFSDSVAGGRGGEKGFDADPQYAQGRGGLGGNSDFNNPNIVSWLNNEGTGNYPLVGIDFWTTWHQGYHGNLDSIGGAGGKGGAGDYHGVPPNNNHGNYIAAPSPGGGGAGGVYSEGNVTSLYGKDGASGAPGNGGGGGGGAAGIFAGGANRAGNGGSGGSGYVQITYPDSSGASVDGNLEFTTPGTFTYNLQNLPSDALMSGTLTFNIWGAGGGGGSVASSSPSQTQTGGGGGSGAYKEVEWPIPSNILSQLIDPNNNNVFNITIEVGQGGQLGVSPGGSSSSGGISKVSYLNSTIVGTGQRRACASGGQGGGVGSPNGEGGQGGSAICESNPNGGIPGNDGATGAFFGAGGMAVDGGYGRGGNGSIVQNQGGFSFPIPGSSGQDGAVIISW